MERKFDFLTQQLSDFKKSVADQLSSLADTVKSWEHRILQLEKQGGVTLEVSNLIENQQKETSLLNHTIASLQDQLNEQEQKSLRYELEIMGIPEQENENLFHLIGLTAKMAGINLDPNLDLESVNRVGPKPKEPKEHKEPSNKKSLPRSVVVRFHRFTKRNELIEATKVRKNLSSTSIGITGPESKLYINERLTKYNRQLFRESRARAKQNGFKYCWVKNGCIYVRKGDKMPHERLLNTSDIDQILGLPNPMSSTAAAPASPQLGDLTGN